MRFHHAFDAFVLPFDEIVVEQLFAIKRESLNFGKAQHTFVDVVLRGRNGLTTLAFVRIDAGEPIWHIRHRQAGEQLLRAFDEAVRKWLQAARPGSDAVLDLFVRDANIEAVMHNEELGSPVLPGLSAYARLFTEAERYAAVAPFLYGSRVVDLKPQSGYGTRTLLPCAAEVVVPEGARHPVAAQFRQLDLAEVSALNGYDVAIALGLEPSAIDETLERAGAAIHRHGRIVVSVRGENAADALEDAGFEVLPMLRPGGEPLGALNETIGVRVSEPVESFRVERPPVSVTPRPLRVLMALRPSAEVAFGGDVVQIRETARALQERGHDVVVSTDPAPQSDGFDIVHLTNLTSPFETLQQAKAVERFPGPVVLMPIFIDHADETTWGMRALEAVFTLATDEQSLQEHLRNLALRNLSVNNIAPPPARVELTANYTAAQMEIVKRIDFAIANAHSEMHRFYRYLATDVPYGIAPSCADPSVYGVYTRRQFEAKYGFADFVLTTGRLEARKNQLLLFEALRDLPYPILCIGKGVDQAYSSLLRAYRAKNVVMLPFMAESELAGAYAAARVVALPSWDEVVSLTSLNSAISEASMVLTRNSYEHEYFVGDAEYCDPGDVGSIRDAVVRAWEGHDARRAQRVALSKRVRAEYSWERSAEMTEALYHRVLEWNPRGVRRLSHYQMANR